MAQDNTTILAKAWLAGTNDFQQRIPDPTQTSVEHTAQALFDPMNSQYYNQFMDILIKRIGYTYVRQQVYKNPLAVFKGQKITYGSTVQEIVPAWVKAHSYEDDVETVFKLHRPDAEVYYHSENRRDKYPITANYDALRTAFTAEDGLNKFIAGIMQSPINADEYDEFQIMKQLIKTYDENWGLFRASVSALPTDDATGKEFLTALQTLGGKIQFPSAAYSGMHNIPVFAKPDELVLLVTPDILASLNVNTLASLFNVDLANVKYRTVMIDKFPMADVFALLTTEDFFVQHDTNYQTSSAYNPETLGTNYWLHHWGIYSVSPFPPAIAFTTERATVVPVITQEVTGLEATADTTTVRPGGSAQLFLNLEGSITSTDPTFNEHDYDIAVRPDAATYVVSSEEGIVLNSRTYVDEYGVLHVQRSGLPDGTELKVVATSTYHDPDKGRGETETFSAEISFTVNEAAPDPEPEAVTGVTAVAPVTAETTEDSDGEDD